MTLHRGFIALALSAIVPAYPGGTNAERTWHSIGPNWIGDEEYGSVSGRISDISIAGTATVYIATANGGIWKRENQAWQQENSGLTNLSFGSIDHHGKLFYASTGEDHRCFDCNWGDGVYKSTDSGATWDYLPSSPEQQTSVIRIGSDDGQIVWLAGSDGLKKSNNGGAVWKPVRRDGKNFLDPQAIVVLPTERAVIVGDTTGLYRSNDGGASWRPLNIHPVANLQKAYPPTGVFSALATSPTSPKELVASFAIKNNNYRGGCLAGLFISHDAGDHWNRLDIDDYFDPINRYADRDPTASCQGWYDNAVAINPKNPKEIVAGGITMYRTTDGGTSWENVGRKAALHPDIHALAYDDAGNLYVGEDGGVVEFPAGKGPVSLNEGLPISQFYGLGAIAQDGDMIAGGTQDNGTNLVRGALGNMPQIPAWKRILGGDGGNVVINQRDPSRLYAEYQAGDLQSFKAGDWADIAPPVISVNWVMPYVVTEDWNTIIAGGENVYRTTTGGLGKKPWVSLGPWPTPEPESTSTPYVTALWASRDGKTIAAGRSDGELAKFFTGSPPWMRETLDSGIDSIVVDEKDRSHAFVSLESQDGCRIAETHDFGKMRSGWLSIKSDIPDCRGATLSLFDARLFIATTRAVYERTSVSHWSVVGEGLPPVPVTALLFIPPQSLVVLTHGRGAWYLANINP